MAISKKGLRLIIVDDKKFFWKFRDKVFVMSEENSNYLLIIDFGWYDIFLYMGSNEKPPDFEPKVATPKFVSEAILFALNNGWSRGKMELKYREKKFTLIDI